MLENLPGGILPANWADFNLAAFSRGKRLWEYQPVALHDALLALWKYFSPPGQTEPERKEAYLRWYLDSGLEVDLDLPLDRSSPACLPHLSHVLLAPRLSWGTGCLIWGPACHLPRAFCGVMFFVRADHAGHPAS